MTSLFDPVRVGSMTLANRVVMAPLTRNRSPGQLPQAMAATYYAQRANPQNGAGLIVTEATPISPTAHGYADTPGIHNADQIAAWKLVTEAVHAAGGKIVVQLWHVGRVSHVDIMPGGQAPVAPSAIAAKTKTVLLRDGAAVFVDTSMPRALDLNELPGIVDDYRRAARNAMEAGFDGVEVHAANGYLLDQFLKSGSNVRTDAYGGSIENRARLLVEVMQAISTEIGGEHTSLRLSPVSPANGVDDADAQPLFTHVVQALAPMKLAYIHIIEGSTGGPREVPDRPFDYTALKAAYRAAGGQAAWMVNNAYDKSLAEQALQNDADLVAFGKPFISNPDLTRRLRENAALNPSDRSTFYGGGAKGYIDYPALA
jgi:N-ethylmaleimide reductase